jgi:hypothetical protein
MYRSTVAHQGNEKYQIYFPVISWHSSSFSYLDYYRLSDIARNAMLMLCYAMLCYAMLCYAMRCAALRCATRAPLPIHSSGISYA